VKTTDRYDILRIMETNGANYEVFTEEIIAFLKRWETRIPFLITECEHDALVINLDVNNPDLPEMVNEAVVLCPDLASSDTEDDYNELISYIRESGGIQFWWD
jgi:hypothetical protein